jgi:phage shock protein C
MHKVVQINLGGFPFTINEDAYVLLQDYLASLKLLFKDDSGAEIMADIESRIAELFSERLEKRMIVDVNDVLFVQEIIGKPEELGQDSPEENQSSQFNSSTSFKTGKRLYRNLDEKVVGGVASGLAAYLGMKDPVWIRILMVLIFLISKGTAILGYFILMAIIKPAKTSKEKLEMRGDPINLANLSRIVEDQVNGISEKFHSKQSGPPEQESHEKDRSSMGDSRAESWRVNLENWLMGLGQSLEYGAKGLMRIFIPIIKLIGALLVIVLMTIWTVILVSLIVGKPFILMFMPVGEVVSSLGLLNLYIVLLAPFLGASLLIIKWFFRTQIPNLLLGLLFGLWFINIVSLIIIGSNTVREFKTPFVLTKQLLNEGISPDVYHIKVDQANRIEGFSAGSISFDDKFVQLTPNRLVIEKSEDEKFYLYEERYARGSSESRASASAMELLFTTRVNQDSILLPEAGKLPISGKFRGQWIRYVLKIPNEKTVHFDRDLGDLIISTGMPGDPVYNQSVRNKKLRIVSDSIQLQH